MTQNEYQTTPLVVGIYVSETPASKRGGKPNFKYKGAQWHRLAGPFESERKAEDWLKENPKHIGHEYIWPCPAALLR